MADLPTTAEVVIIGGGAVGCSTAYHLAKMGITDVLLLEKNELTAGSSWHAAGNCPNFSASWSVMKMQNYSIDLYQRLGEEVDYPYNYHITGSIRLAHSIERMREFERVAAMARHQGIDGFEMMNNGEMRQVYPFLETHDLEGGCWDPLDGDIDPAQITQAFARGARTLGAKIVRFCPVTGISRAGDEWVVKTEKGSVRCRKVVNAAGYYADRVWQMFKPFGAYPERHLPIVTLAHQYLITEEIAELQERDGLLPLLRDPDSSYYLRQEKDGLLLGPYERDCKAHWHEPGDPTPDDFSFQLYPDDLDRLEWYIEDACARVPVLGSAGITRVVNGPIPYTPDGNPLIGPMPGVPNAFEACVFTFGIVQAGGAGKVAAEWVAEGETEWDMWSVDPRRFTRFADHDYAVAKGIEVYSHEYAMHFPHHEWPAGRPKRLSPVHDRIAALGARFGARAGWERAVWYGDGPDDQVWVDDADTWARDDVTYAAIRAECHAVRDAVGICDMPGFSRYTLSGPGAADWLKTMVTGTIPSVGRIGLAYFADDHGRILTEMTVMRTGTDEMVLLGAAGAEWHDLDRLRAHLSPASGITIENITDDYSCLIVSGPKTRALLDELVGIDLSSDAFRWLAHNTAEIAGRAVNLIRVSYVGELGWEVHCANADMPAVFDAIMAAGKAHGIRPFGMYAMESLRLEKGYRAWKQDLSTDYTMLSGGLDRFIKWDKPDFIGKPALERIRDQGSPERFAILTVEAEACDAPYLATVWQGETRVGLVTSGGWGHRVDKSIALGVVDTRCAEPGTTLDVEIYGKRRRAVVEAEPHYDPANERLRA